jgi:hypothetical protein
MPFSKTTLKSVIISGLKKGLESALSIMKLVAPISLAVALLQWSGILFKVNFILNPLMALLHLPGEAALPILSGMLVNEYTGIALMTVIPFSTAQMTLIAIFIMIAHSLILEAAIQMKAGINAFKITVIRLIAAIVTVLAVGYFLGDTAKSAGIVNEIGQSIPLIDALKSWGTDTLTLAVKVYLILTGVMLFLEAIRGFGLMDRLTKLLRPLMIVQGLSDRAGISWLAANLFGITYAAPVIIDEAKAGTLSKEELEYLHISIGINHSIIEDPMLFVAMGLPALLLWIPKILMGIMAVLGFRAYNRLRARRQKQIEAGNTGSESK